MLGLEARARKSEKDETEHGWNHDLLLIRHHEDHALLRWIVTGMFIGLRIRTVFIGYVPVRGHFVTVVGQYLRATGSVTHDATPRASRRGVVEA
jgi:hypothetical protein